MIQTLRCDRDRHACQLTELQAQVDALKRQLSVAACVSPPVEVDAGKEELEGNELQRIVAGVFTRAAKHIAEELQQLYPGSQSESPVVPGLCPHGHTARLSTSIGNRRCSRCSVGIPKAFQFLRCLQCHEEDGHDYCFDCCLQPGELSDEDDDTDSTELVLCPEGNQVDELDSQLPSPTYRRELLCATCEVEVLLTLSGVQSAFENTTPL